MKAELTLPPELVEEIADRVAEEILMNNPDILDNLATPWPTMTENRFKHPPPTPTVGTGRLRGVEG